MEKQRFNSHIQEAKLAFTQYYGMGNVKPICGDYLHDIALAKLKMNGQAKPFVPTNQQMKNNVIEEEKKE